MNPYHMLGIIALSILIYVLLVAMVTLTGISVIGAMVGVYATMFGCMMSMQKRASQAYIPQADRRRVILANQPEDIALPSEDRTVAQAVGVGASVGIASGGIGNHAIRVGESH